MTAIYKRELKSYFTNMTAYIFMAFMLLIVGFFCKIYNLSSYGYAQFELVLYAVCLVFVAIIPLLTMRSFAQEKYEKTDSLLYSLPIKMSGIVMGKYLAMLTVYLIPMLIMCLYPLVLSIFGPVNFAQTYSAMLAYYLLGAALIAIGMFMSSLTESQVIAAVLGMGALFIIYLMPNIASSVPTTNLGSYICFVVLILAFALVIYVMTKNVYAAVISGLVLEVILLVLYLVNQNMFASAFPNMLKQLSLFERFYGFINGFFDIGGIVYYLSVCCVFVFLTTQSLEKKRYS